MNTNNIKELYLNNDLLPDLGIMISYGVGEDLVSMGIFFIGGYYDLTGKKLDNLPQDKSEVEVEFVEYELTENGEVRQKENGAKIMIPYNKAQKLYSDIASVNYDIVYNLLEGKYDSRKLLTNFNKNAYDAYAEHPELIQTGFTGLKSETLESLNGYFTSHEGDDMGTDFRVFPFLYNMIMQKFIEVDNSNDKLLKNKKLYNFIYLVNYGNEKKKEEEPKPDIGIIIEPGPNSFPTPNILYEQQQENENHIRR